MPEQDPTRHPRYPLPSVEEIFRDTGLNERNIIFDSPEVARSFVGAWIEEEEADFKGRTGWTLTTTELNSMSDTDSRRIKKCIIYMVELRLYQRAIGVRPSESDHYQNLREEIRRQLFGIWGRGGMIRGLWKPSVDVTMTALTYEEDTITERITEV